MNDLQLQATYYHSMGMNIAPIYGREDDPSSFKNPGIDIDKWHKERQTIEDIMSFNWSDATGIGLITGYNGFRAIDIDGVKDDFLTVFFKNRFLGVILEDLGLPINYEWLVLSGSGTGCHIIFKNDDIPEMDVENYPFLPGSFMEGYLRNRYRAFDRIELSWNYFLVLPPSCSLLYPNKQSYGFWKWEDLPKKAPNHISNENLANMFFKWCADDRLYSYRYKNNDYELFCRECLLGMGYGYPSQNISYNDCRGLLMQCDEGKNFLAVNKELSLVLLKSSRCNNARVNMVSLMAVGYIETSYTKVNKQLKELLEEGILTADGYDKLEKLAQLNCRLSNRLMFFDTETNGLPSKYYHDITDQPRVVQLSWIVADEDGNVQKRFGCLIKPVDFDISDEAVKVHGITKEKAMRDGILIKEAISLFLADLNSCNALVGHNVSFDIQVLRGELKRLNITNAIHEIPYYCTMRLSVDYCKLPTEAAYIRNFSQYLSYSLRHPREYKYKFPKLIELYEFLFDERFDNAHDANADIEATAKCFFELIKRKVITYKPTDKTYDNIITLKYKATNILNDNILSCVERWQVYRSNEMWLVKAILMKDRIIKIPLLLELSSKGVQLEDSSSSKLNLYGLNQCEYFFICTQAIAISKIKIAQINFEADSFVIDDVVWRNNCKDKWQTRQVRSFTKEEQEAVSKSEVVASQYGKSVCFYMRAGGQTHIPLSINSRLSVGDTFDLSTGKVLTLSRKGSNDITRVEE
ncbi:MAG: bifunctional DNA primase/polymerase [Alloprevotella sp.]|nr:bifunctional DNA primase/polymerase [Alloprevotella sp.]